MKRFGMDKGKAICETLKQLRIAIAKANNIEYYPRECAQVGPCYGTCPTCEEELDYINSVIEHRQSAGVECHFDGCANIDDTPALMVEPEEKRPLVGDVAAPDEVILAGIPHLPHHSWEDDLDVDDEEQKPKTVRSPKRKKQKVVVDSDILLTHFTVAGTTHAERADEVSWEIEEGDKMTMKRNPRNKYDKNAIGIYYRNIRIGWVPKSDNAILARLMDGERRLYFLTTSIDYQGDWLKIEGDVYMKK